ncbi:MULTISPECIES: carbohydrate ABC transporter permease [Paenibacillus]|uniref:Carbohydrate ABC transporter permease n=2 Tax=Paenibacillus TaxID=44249 RepID=A0ABU6DH25_9BACL|nr:MULTISPECIES: carbohydrate ABC transporter permease [Paenibacillus]MBA2944077.1 carbohydrate ABC transporter permease [Paenibacillus sp. CGMCC 1.16610]MCY9663272.1 carbohydrate ABC transporter permease [Paenibacillus anseongense]MEB4797069.1 carbohydrate ABC transporter permease [Paenibacillus chondroitinus]MVQ37966.1 ABC transporter permease subunit [Paenibacillus anseongense]
MTGRIQETADDRLFTILNYIILFIFTITILYPLVYIVSASFSSSTAVISGRVWLYPVEPTLAGYEAVFKHRLIMSSFLNSVFYTVVGTTINVLFTLIAAYPLSRKDFMPRNAIMALFVFTMMFSGGLIPSYLVVKELGMIDTRWSLLIPGALAVMNMIIARTYFQTTIPEELLEAAQMDGCSDFTFVRKIVIPLSGPIIAVISLFYAVGHWNQYFNALLYLKHQELYPIQLVLRDILVQNEVDASMITDVADQAARDGLRELLKFSLIVVSTLPVLIIYPFIQKHFVKGMMIGSLKG